MTSSIRFVWPARTEGIYNNYIPTKAEEAIMDMIGMYDITPNPVSK